MSQSRTAGWASDAPTPAQLKEFFAQIESGRVTKASLQHLLRSKPEWQSNQYRQALVTLRDELDIAFVDEALAASSADLVASEEWPHELLVWRIRVLYRLYTNLGSPTSLMEWARTESPTLPNHVQPINVLNGRGLAGFYSDAGLERLLVRAAHNWLQP